MLKLPFSFRITKEILLSDLFEVLNSLKLFGITPTKNVNISCKKDYGISNLIYLLNF